jgi:HEAT repeat protein
VVTVDVDTYGGDLPPELRNRTRTHEAVRGSLPQHQIPGYVPPRPGAPGAAKPKSRLGLILAAALGVAAVAGGTFFVLGGKSKAQDKVAEAPPAPPSSDAGPKDASAPADAQLPEDLQQPSDAIKKAFDASDLATARKLAEAHLRQVIERGTLQEQGLAVDALGFVRRIEAAPLLYLALKKDPAVRVKASAALADLRLPDAAEKVRAALAGSGGAPKVQLAAALFRLGDKEAKAILLRALEDLPTRLTAAAALAEGGDAAGLQVLKDALAAATPERSAWWQAAGGLLKLGDADVRKLLEAELSQSAAIRKVRAAALLAGARDAKAREQLGRMAADPDFTQRGEAALALARLDDARASEWVESGLASTDSLERVQALAICAAFSAAAQKHGVKIAALAAEDPDFSVRLAAEAVILGMAGAGGTQ